MARRIQLICSLLFLLGGNGLLLAELPLTRLLTIFPPGGKAGTQVEVTVAGADLDEANRLHFSHAGITAKQKLGETNGLPEANKFVVTIAANVPPGVYDARVVGRFGISNPRAFVVSDLPESIAPTTNSSATAATALSLGTIVNGHSEANAVDYFKFTAKKGQRILIECKAKEIDSRMDAALILYDAAGKELERNRRGGLVDFTVPADGDYVIKVHDFVFRGGGEYFYRLAVNTAPRIDFIFPPSGLPGTKGKYVLYGRNLPGSTPAKDFTIEGKSLEQLEVEIELPRDPAAQTPLSPTLAPADATLDAFEYRLRTPQGVSNPVLISLATGPVVTERQPNDQPAQAQTISPPCEYVGQLYPQGDRDWVTFEAKKGDVYWVEMFSQRLGLPTDPFALIQRVTKNDKGEETVSDVKELYDTEGNFGGAEYKTATRDPSGRFEAPEAGMYRIEVRDFFNRFQADPRLVYRLSIRKETPDFRLVAVAQAPPSPNKDAKEALVWTPLVRRGETVPIKVMAFRRDNFNGEIHLKVDGLPAGVSCNDAKIEPDKNSTVLLLTAAENAASWVGPVKVVGKAKIGDVEVAREGRGGTVNWTVTDYNNEAVQSRLSRDFVLGVGVEAAPVSIEPSEAKTWETSVAGKLPIPLTLVRRAEFNANLKLKAVGLPALDKLKEIEVDGKATNATLQLDLTEHKIPAGNYSFYLQTQTTGKYRNNPEAAKAAEEALKEVEKQIAELTAKIKAAPEAKRAATKAAAESAAKAKAAADGLTAANKTADEDTALAKTAAEKLAAASAALEQKSDDKELVAAKETAAKAAEEATVKSKTASEAKVAAEKESAEAAAKAKADAEAQKAAELAETELTAQLKEVEKKKELAATRAKETAKTAEPKDMTVTVYSAPINLKVTPAPITLSATQPAGQLEQGKKIEIPVQIRRLYDYADPVELTLELPKGVSGLTVPKLTIPKDQSAGTLVVEAAGDATPGEHKVTLQAALKLNNQDLKVDQGITLKVAGAQKSAAK